jgi:hypothetical protein
MPGALFECSKRRRPPTPPDVADELPERLGVAHAKHQTHLVIHE